MFYLGIHILSWMLITNELFLVVIDGGQEEVKLLLGRPFPVCSEHMRS